MILPVHSLMRRIGIETEDLGLRRDVAAEDVAGPDLWPLECDWRSDPTPDSEGGAPNEAIVRALSSDPRTTSVRVAVLSGRASDSWMGLVRGTVDAVLLG